MKCAHCGNDIEMGSVFCRSCGREAQIVPDYNVLEDDILTSILEEKKVSETTAEKERKAPGCAGKAEPLWKQIPFKAGLILTGLVLCIGVAAAVYFNSYEYHMSAGSRLDAQKSYREALEHYLKAANSRDGDGKPLAGAGHDYLLLKEYEPAKECLQKAIAADPSGEDAYLDLIQVYVETSEYDAIERLLEDVKDGELLQRIEKHLIAPPVFNVEEGKFTDDVHLELSCVDGHEIYLTLDGADPTKRGIRYRDPIVLEDGEYMIRAVCKDDAGKYSRVTERRYEIIYEKPDYPKVTPMQGTFDAPTQIFMEAPGEGCRIYYTWDGTTPTMASPEYTGPIDVLEGNNVLSIIVIDKHGLCSDVLKCNYKYLP